MVAHGMVLLSKKEQNVQKHTILVYTCPKNNMRVNNNKKRYNRSAWPIGHTKYFAINRKNEIQRKCHGGKEVTH